MRSAFSGRIAEHGGYIAPRSPEQRAGFYFVQSKAKSTMPQTIHRSHKFVLVKGDASQWQVAITRETIQRILKSDAADKGDMIALWMFYAYTAKWQHVNRPHATTAYTAKGLGWSVERVRKVKKGLASLHLVADAITKNNNGKVVGWYVQVFHLTAVSDENLVAYETPTKNHPTGFPEGGKRGVKCSRTGNLNALGVNKSKEIQSPISSGGCVRPTREFYEEFLSEEGYPVTKDYDQIPWDEIYAKDWKPFVRALHEKMTAARNHH